MPSTEVKVTVVLPILIQHEWQAIMTECCIRTMACTTDIPYHLIVVETGDRWIGYDFNDPIHDYIDNYIYLPNKTSYTHDYNVGLKEATTEFVVHMGNDVMTRPGWLEGMFEMFDKHPTTCGFASPAFNEHYETEPGDDPNQDMLGFYPHCMMFRREYGLLDEAGFPSVFSDTDMVARIHVERNLLPLVNPRVRVADMINQTFSGGLETKEQAKQKFEVAREEFRRRYGNTDNIWIRSLCGYDDNKD